MYFMYVRDPHHKQQWLLRYCHYKETLVDKTFDVEVKRITF